MTDEHQVSVAESVAPHDPKPETWQQVEDPIGLKLAGGAFKKPTIQHMERGTEPDGHLGVYNIDDQSQGSEMRSFS